MKITFLSDASSWKNPYIEGLARDLRKKGHRTAFLHEANQVSASDILFILGFFKMVPDAVLKRSRISVVVHESALPKGRGWSPMAWLVLEGSREIPLTLFEAVAKVDAGQVFFRDRVKIDGTELMPELRAKVGPAMMTLCRNFTNQFPRILKKGIKQKGKPTYYLRRTPADSQLDPKKSIAQQFNLLRIADNKEYPAFFTHQGQTYLLKIEKKKD